MVATPPMLPGQIPWLVKDINAIQRENPGCRPSGVTRAAGLTFFSAYNELTGQELYRMDGTAAGTVLVRDLFPGRCGSAPDGLTEFGGALYFCADDGVHGRELWKTDGTAAGTVLVVDLVPGPAGAEPSGFVAWGALLIFSAVSPLHGRELFRSDGTAAGTALVSDIEPGAPSSSPQELTALPNGVVFAARAAAHGQEIWRTDGTAAGTTLLRDVEPGPASSDPAELTEAGGRIWFRARDATQGEELWATDGTAAGTRLAADIAPGVSSSTPSALTGVGSRLFFRADDGVHGEELWTASVGGGAVLTLDINPGARGSSPAWLAPFGNVLVFTAFEPNTLAELWRSDGTAAGTWLLKDLRPSWYSSAVEEMTEVAGTLWFTALTSSVYQRAVWKSDGTTVGTTMVRDFPWSGGGPHPRMFTARGSGNDVLFFVDDNVHGDELWASDGTNAGTQLLVDVNPPMPGRTESSYPHQLIDVLGVTYFVADDGVGGPGLWRTDGTSTGTSPVAFAIPGAGPAEIRELTAVGDRLFFTATYRHPFERELWVSDGTPTGTRVVVDMVGSGNPTSLVAFGGRLLFAADDSASAVGRELYVTDGTASGTRLVSDLLPGPDSSAPDQLTRAADVVYFTAFTDAHGRELWRTDGTAAGTSMVRDIVAGPAGSYPLGLVALGSELFFVAGPPNDCDPWWSDGSASGTRRLRDGCQTWINYSYDTVVTGWNGRVWFMMDDCSGIGVGLWSTDGTPAGTRLIADINPGPAVTGPSFLAGSQSCLFFFVHVGAHGFELWKTDGTTAGTVLVADPWSEFLWAYAHRLTAIGSRHVWFEVIDGVHGSKAWVSDGTASGTRMVGEPCASTAGYPGEFTLSAGRLLMSMGDAMSGLELFAVDPGATAQAVGRGCAQTGGSAPQLVATDPVLGGSTRIEGSKGQSGLAAALVVGLPTSSPRSLFGCLQLVDPVLLWVPVGSPAFTLTLGIPADPNLDGAILALQSWYFPL